MKRIYTFGHEEVERNLTVGDIIENKANDVKMTQVTAQNAEEAEILADQDIDMIITGSDWYEDVRSGAPNTFITAALFAGRYITNDEILEGAFKAAMAGADSVLTPRGMDVVEWPILKNDFDNIGFTVHLMDKGVDTGDILFFKNVKPIKNDNIKSLSAIDI